jgi:hypothetical protein
MGRGQARCQCIGGERLYAESSEHPLMVGQSGEAYARLAIESDGSMLFGTGANARNHLQIFRKEKDPLCHRDSSRSFRITGGGAFDTTLRRSVQIKTLEETARAFVFGIQIGFPC